MGRPAYRKSLTNLEFDAISTLTMHSKLDNSFDVYENTNGTDCFYDYDEDRAISLHQGLELLYEAIAYPLSHEGLTVSQSEALVKLFKEFKVGDNDWYEWLLKEEEEEECQTAL